MLCGSEDIDATLRNLVPLSLHDYQAGDPSPQDCCKTRRHEVQEHAHQVRGLLRWFNPPNVSNGSNPELTIRALMSALASSGNAVA